MHQFGPFTNVYGQGNAAKIVDNLVTTMTKNDKTTLTSTKPQIANLILLGFGLAKS